MKALNILCPIHNRKNCLRLKEDEDGLSLIVVDQEFDDFDIICIKSDTIIGTVNIKIIVDEKSFKIME